MGDDQGRRMDSAFAYLEPVLGPAGSCKDNLEIIQGATVSKILLNGSRAYGVEYLLSPDGEPQVGNWSPQDSFSCFNLWLDDFAPYLYS